MSRKILNTLTCGTASLAAVLAMNGPAVAARHSLDSTTFASVGSFDTGAQGLLFAKDMVAGDGLHAWTIIRGIPAGGTSFQSFSVYDGAATGSGVSKYVYLKPGTTAYLKVCDKTSQGGPELNCSATKAITA